MAVFKPKSVQNNVLPQRLFDYMPTLLNKVEEIDFHRSKSICSVSPF